MIRHSLVRRFVVLWCLCLAVAAGAATPADLTFFVVSDTHYATNGHPANVVGAKLIAEMNQLPGKEYPANVGGDTIDTPRGVIHLGDITNDGKPASWAAFVRDFGLTGRDGRLLWPLFEGFGNHDGGINTLVRRSVAQRNKQRPGLTNISANGRHYSWDWGFVHFVHLNISCGTTQRTYSAQNSYEFLKQDLEKHAGSHHPVILFQHLGFGPHSNGFWTEEARTQLHDLIQNYNVLAIFHGHEHTSHIYQWRDFDVFHCPHLRLARPPITAPGAIHPPVAKPSSHGFFVVHITPQTMTVVTRMADGSWSLSKQKQLAN